MTDTAANNNAPPKRQDNALTDILVNVIVPVVALNFLSKEHRLGPLWALILATSVPVIYGIWYGWARRRVNFFSALGFASILLTGGMGLAGADALWFALKEAMIPIALGIAILGSCRTASPLLNVFLLRPEFFDLELIDAAVKERGVEAEAGYRELMWRGSWMLAASFFVSAALNFILAFWLLSGKESDPVAYNEAIGKITGVGFLVIGVPLMAATLWTLSHLVNRIAALTELEPERFFMDKKRDAK